MGIPKAYQNIILKMALIDQFSMGRKSEECIENVWNFIGE